MFITGTPDLLNRISNRVKAAIPEINLQASPRSDDAAMNKQDLVLFMASRLKDSECFRKADNSLKRRIQDELMTGTRGDFTQLQYLLEDISNSRSVSQVEDVLCRASYGRKQLIGSKVDSLNQSLDRGELEDVNEILRWVTTAFEDLKIDEHETILSFKTEVRTVVYLEKRMRERYLALFDVDEGKRITLRPGILEHLLAQTEHARREMTSSGGRTSDLHISEVVLVQKLVRTYLRNIFGDDHAYDRFHSDNFFHSKNMELYDKFACAVAKTWLETKERGVRRATVRWLSGYMTMVSTMSWQVFMMPNCSSASRSSAPIFATETTSSRKPRSIQ